MFMPTTSHPNRSSNAGMIVAPAPRTQSSATLNRLARMASTSRYGMASTDSMWRRATSSSCVTVPILSHAAYGMPVSTRSRIAAPSLASRKSPLDPIHLSAFHSIGLWLADSISPPAAWWCSTANWQPGVVVSPMSMTSQPTSCSVPTTMRWNMGPETRLSRPTTMAREGLFPIDHAPNAAAYRATTSGVNASPTRPRIPDTPTISPLTPCDMTPPSMRNQSYRVASRGQRRGAIARRGAGISRDNRTASVLEGGPLANGEGPSFFCRRHSASLSADDRDR